ncbi:MAG: serine hydrolase, partial [Bacteroidia bacterium]
MLKYNLLLVLLFSLNSLQLFAQKKPNLKETTETSARLRIILDSVYNRYPETKGIGICIMSAQKKFTWCGAVGKANTKGDSLLVNHPVNIASVTKIYVAATILRLVEQGKLNTETPIQKLLSKQTITLLQGDGYELDKIKVKHLLT